MTLGEARTDCYDRLGFSSSPGTEVETRITRFLNTVHKEILSHPNCAKLRRRTLALTATANLPTIAFPQAVTGIYNIIDRVNQRPVHDIKSVSAIRGLNPGNDVTSSAPEVYALVGYNQPVFRQPTEEITVVAISSSAGDTQQITIKVSYPPYGALITSTLVLTGNISKSLGSALSIENIYLASAAAGDISIYANNTSGDLLSVIQASKTRPRYTVIEMYPIPATAYTLYSDCELFIDNLTGSNEEFLIPDAYCGVLINGVREKEYDDREKTGLAAKARADMIADRARLWHHLHQVGSFTYPSDIGARRSQLGPYFPAGS